LVVEDEVIYKGRKVEDPFILQSHELVMNFVSNEWGIVILDSRGVSRSKMDNNTRVSSSTYSLVLNPMTADIISTMILPIFVKKT